MEYASWTVLVTLALAVGIAGWMSGCGHLIPTRASVDEERYLGPEAEPPSPRGKRAVDVPVLPFLVWGLHFDEELVMELADHPTWRMLEIVRVDLDGEQVWFSLDSHRCGRQWVAVNERSERVAAGFPAPTYLSDLAVERTEDEREIRYGAAWTMQSGERIEVDGLVRKPLKTTLLRNGNSMNHSQETALAVIDLEQYRKAKVVVRIDGQPQKVVGLSRVMLVQVAAGLMEGDATFCAGEAGAVGMERSAGSPVEYLRSESDGGITLSARRPTGVESWDFTEERGVQHLREVRVEQQGSEVLRLRINPPLPDLRYPAKSESEHRMVASLNGIEGYMSAVVRVGPGAEKGTTAVAVDPDFPRWAAARPVRSVVRYSNGVASLETSVEATAPWSFGDVPCPGQPGSLSL